MEKNNKDQQNDNQPKEINMVLNSSQTPLNIEQNTKMLKDQLSNIQNNPDNPLSNENNPHYIFIYLL